jgi:hypothetical protein
MSTLAIASILEELRCMDGELFKAEICQRLFIWLKSQANETLEPVFLKSNAEYSKVLDAYRLWSSEVAQEELLALQEKAGGTEELQSAWVAVSLHWVRLNKKADTGPGGRTSVKIKTPDPRDLLKNFFVSLCSKSWCTRGDLWSMDPVKQDFVFREVFRQSVGNSIHFLQETAEPLQESAKDKKVPRESSSHQSMLQEHREINRSEPEYVKNDQDLERLAAPKEKEAPLPKSATTRLQVQEETITPQAVERQKQEERTKGLAEEHAGTKEVGRETPPPSKEIVETSKGVSKLPVHEKAEECRDLGSEKHNNEAEQRESLSAKETQETEDDGDDIGPDDSVSQFFSGSAKESNSAPTFPPMQPPAKRYADAGTVMYNSAPRRVLVKPITLKLENPVQKPLE